MSVENPQVEPTVEVQADPTKSVNGEQRLNGISNGHSEAVSASGASGGEKKHKSSHHKSSKDKHRDKERSEHKSSSSKSSHRDKEKSSSSNHHKSSSSSHHKSSRDKDRDRERHHKSSRDDKERPKEDRERPKEDKEKSKDDKERSKDEKSSHSKDKDREKDKDKPREKTSSSSGDKHRDREKDKDRHHKSSSSHSGSNRDKHSSSSSKHRDKDKDRERHKERSDKDRHRDKEKERERRERKERERREKEKRIKEEQEETSNQDIEEVAENDPLATSWMQDDKVKMDAVVKLEPLEVSHTSSCDYSLSQFNPNESSFKMKEEDQESIKQEEDEDEESEEDVPLHKRKKAVSDEEEDEKPLTVRKKVKSEKKSKRRSYDSEDEEEDVKPKKKKIKKEKVKTKAEIKTQVNHTPSPTKGRKKKDDQPEEVWKWWEEEKREDGVKWNFLEHKGPVFAPPYEPLPDNVIFEYDGRKMKLSQDTEEIATFYARMLDHDYTSKKVFNDNFFKDWRKTMTSKEREVITDLRKCNFRSIAAHFQKISEANKSRTKEEKLRIKEENERMIKEYGFCTIDGHKEKIGNFKIEPPGLFRGRGEHPKMGMVKRRVVASDILINCSKNSDVPKAPPGFRWKEVRHDNTVTWLASWVENIQGQVKYIMLNPSSKLKGEKDWQKYETARRLDKQIDKIRSTYRDEWKSKEMRVRQRAVALYFIDILALRAGNEKDEDQADTVGCCSLRVEHIQLHRELNGKEYVVVFDFLGKDSIRYYNEVEVEKRVFKNLELFCENKKEGDDLFDRLNTSVLNEHLRELMEGLTAKVFRTYNASITLQRQLDLLTDPDATVPEKLLQYNRANRAVAILCNHQRAVPKSHSKSMENLKEKIRAKREAVDDCEAEVKDLQKVAKRGSVKEKLACDKKKKQLERLKEQLQKLELQETDRDENKTIALGTSKLNYLDPRISVAWCKKYQVPIEKIFNKTQRDKFRWAIDMADEDYRF